MTTEEITKRYFILGVALGLADTSAFRIDDYNLLDNLSVKERICYKLAKSYVYSAIERRYHSFDKGQNIIDNTIKTILKQVDIHPIQGLKIGILIMNNIKIELKNYTTKTTDKKFFKLIENAFKEVEGLISNEDIDVTLEILEALETATK